MCGQVVMVEAMEMIATVTVTQQAFIHYLLGEFRVQTRSYYGIEHGLSSELTPTPFSTWLAQPPRQTKQCIRSARYSELISITTTLLSVYLDVNMTEELKYFALYCSRTGVHNSSILITLLE